MHRRVIAVNAKSRLTLHMPKWRAGGPVQARLPVFPTVVLLWQGGLAQTRCPHQ